MSIKEKIRNLRKRSLTKPIAGEKSGVLNGLVVLGAIAGSALLASEKASAALDCNPSTHDIDKTNINPNDGVIDTNSWGNHYWWDHSWYNHGWGSGGT